MKNKLFALISFILSAFVFLSCSNKSASKAKSIAVFVPGIMADSPIYASLAEGVKNGVEEYNASLSSDSPKVLVDVVEAGTNQAEWQTKIIAVAATGKYDVIISSNPSLPQLVEPITSQFPKQKFILLDASCEGNTAIAAVSYDQRSQSYLSGYIASLMSKSHKVGFIAAQEYPVMNNILMPYYKMGAEAANADTTTDFRIVGNWYDASKGAELTQAMAKTGVDVILPICGGASQGVISAAKELGIKLNWFDENGFYRAPGTIISSAVVQQKDVAKRITTDYLNSKDEIFGTTLTVGIKEGCIELIQDDENYINTVPEDVRQKVKDVYTGLKNGTIILP